MHLKTLTIKGFKSFASSTTLRLEPGITAVVGPNGSGKSNVVDALTWVMGEQGAKNLRGGTMADVIFAGAGSRPALGRAEVSLTIDNADGALPIDYSEVTITRTLFRGGGSEYQINGAACRLLDVQELLSDTGLGRQMHVIVGQGQLDAVLAATPEDRRGFIEEAAGVLKHRRRKERALRKLDSMAADLARVADLTNELHRQLGPLAKQAAVARRARTIQIEVRDATARLLADDVVAAQQLLEAGQEDAAAVTARRAAAEEAERAARARLAGLVEAEAGTGRRLAAATEVWEELTGAAQRLSSLADVAAERVRGLANTPEPSFGTDPDELDRRAEAAAAEEAELAERIESTRSALAAATQERSEAEAAQSTAESALAALQRSQAEHREKVARAGGRLASARSRHEAATSAREQARAALAAAEERRAAAQSALEEAAPGSGEAARADGGASGEQVEATARHEAATAALASARDALAAATEARSQAASEQATWTARRDALALSLRAEDATAELAEAGLQGLLGPLPEHLSIEKGWENAIAALLGDLAAAALAADEAAALGALDHARRAEAGAIRLVIAQERDGDGGGGAADEPAPRWRGMRPVSIAISTGLDPCPRWRGPFPPGAWSPSRRAPRSAPACRPRSIASSPGRGPCPISRSAPQRAPPTRRPGSSPVTGMCSPPHGPPVAGGARPVSWSSPPLMTRPPVVPRPPAGPRKPPKRPWRRPAGPRRPVATTSAPPWSSCAAPTPRPPARPRRWPAWPPRLTRPPRRRGAPGGSWSAPRRRSPSAQPSSPPPPPPWPSSSRPPARAPPTAGRGPSGAGRRWTPRRPLRRPGRASARRPRPPPPRARRRPRPASPFAPPRSASAPGGAAPTPCAGPPAVSASPGPPPSALRSGGRGSSWWPSGCAMRRGGPPRRVASGRPRRRSGGPPSRPSAPSPWRPPGRSAMRSIASPRRSPRSPTPPTARRSPAPSTALAWRPWPSGP
nr:AAA family ATPase [Actinomyces denticolens]